MASSTSLASSPCPSALSLSSSPCLSRHSTVPCRNVAFPLKARGRFSSSLPRASSQQVTNDPQKLHDVSKALAEDGIPKVFTDESVGVVCYQTESGEIVCEGLDEGPHFYPPSGSNFYMPDTRVASILPFFGEGMYEI